VQIIRNFHLGVGLYAKSFFYSQSSKPNELIFEHNVLPHPMLPYVMVNKDEHNSVFLKGPHG